LSTRQCANAALTSINATAKMVNEINLILYGPSFVSPQSAPISSRVALTFPVSMSRTFTIGYPTMASALATQAS